MNKKSLAKLLLLVIIVMFLFPWVLVSCQGQKIMSATGFQLVTGHYSMSNLSMITDYTGGSLPATGPSSLIILVLLLSALGLTLGLARRGRTADRVIALLSSLQSLLLLGFLIFARAAFYVKLSQGSTDASVVSALQNAVQFQLQPAFYITLLLSLGCTFLCISALRSRDDGAEVPVAADSPPRPSISPRVDTSGLQFCPACGAQNPKGNTFCSNCGVKLTKED